jgi:CRISPR/Cas system-associated endonuclease Cas3-HD
MNLVLALAVLVGIGGALRAAAPQKDAAPKTPDKVLLGQAQVKQLLLMMDADKNGTISKQEWMDYMSKEFDRLDTDHSGQLDVKELAQSNLRSSHTAAVGK